jgi:hypothetical protein
MAVAIVAAGSLVAVGVTPWLLLALVAFAWFRVVARHAGAALAVCTVLISASLLLLATAMLTAAVHVDLLLAFSIVMVVVGLAGCMALRQAGVAVPLSTDPALPLFAAIGPAIWGIASIFWAFLPDERRLGWVMRNDSVNNLVFAREAIAQHGIVPGGGQNPAPFPAAVIALAASAGRGQSPSAGLLLHDLSAMSATWMLLIGLTALLSGFVAGEVARRASAAPVAVRWATALGSVLVFTWYVTGYPMEYGFFNVSVALPVLLISVLLSLRAAEAPWLAASGLFATSLLMLAIWSPLVVVPGGLALAAVLGGPRLLFSAGRKRSGVLAATLLALLLYFGLVSVPSLLSQKGALSSAGGVHLGFEWAVFAIGFAVLIAGFRLSRLQAAPILTVSCAVVLSSWLGATVLLVLNRHAASPWTYYPVKFVWIASVVLLVILSGMVVALIDRASRRWTQISGSVLTVAFVALLAIWSPTTINYDGINPVARLFATHPLENLDKVHRFVLSSADPAHPTISWKLMSPPWADGEANMWLFQVRSDEPRLSATNRTLAVSSYGTTSMSALCTVQRILGPGLTVETADSHLEAELRGSCPDSTARIVVRDPPR